MGGGDCGNEEDVRYSESITSGLSANFIKQTLPADFSLNFFVRDSISVLENRSGLVQPVTHRRSTLQIGKAEEFRMGVDMTLTSPQGLPPRHVTNRQYVVARPEQDVVTLGSLATQSET